MILKTYTRVYKTLPIELVLREAVEYVSIDMQSGFCYNSQLFKVNDTFDKSDEIIFCL